MSEPLDPAADLAPPPTPPTPAPPPAASLVIHGDVRSEREVELQHRLDAAGDVTRRHEFRVSELELENQELKKIPAPPKPPRQKRFGPIPIFYQEDEA